LEKLKQTDQLQALEKLQPGAVSISCPEKIKYSTYSVADCLKIKVFAMAKPSTRLVATLREAAVRLKNGAHYAWGHHGACNCGHLLQVITRLDEAAILAHAHTGTGEWTEMAAESCPVTGVPVSLLVSKLEEAGLTPVDIHHIEYLDDKEVLQNLPGGFRWLKRNIRQDVIDYFETFARLLEEKLLPAIPPPAEIFIKRKTGPHFPEPVPAQTVFPEPFYA
jgi:hypothetical protein